MTNHRGKPRLIFRDRQNAGVNANLAARQTKRICLRAFKNDEFPLRIRHVFTRDRRDAFADFLHQRIRRRIVADGRGLFQFVKARQAELHLLARRNQVQLMPAGDRHRVATADQRQQKHQRHTEDKMFERFHVFNKPDCGQNSNWKIFRCQARQLRRVTGAEIRKLKFVA